MATNTCPKCGHELTGQPKFCPDCGVALETAVKTPTLPPPPRSSHLVRDIGIIAAVLFLVAIGYVVLREPHQQAPASAGQSDRGMSDADAELLNNLPDDFEQLIGMGNEQMDDRNYPVAAEIYARALEIRPSALNVRTDFGACLHGMGLPGRAKEEFRRVLSEDPSHAVAHFNLGVVFLTEDQADSARFYLEKYLQLDPQGPAVESARDLLKDLNG